MSAQQQGLMLPMSTTEPLRKKQQRPAPLNLYELVYFQQARDSSSSIRDDYFIEMKRPKEICKDPQFYVDGYSRFDINQGKLGDCFFLASLANVAMNKKLFLKVVPEGQSFEDGKYTGIFHFRFWSFGEWIDITVNDYLATCNNELIYLRSSEQNEFWCPLLEKAYAKFRGKTYKAIDDGGIPADALQDLTGGLTEIYDMTNLPNEFYTILLQAHANNVLITCTILEGAETNLPTKHAYSITKVMYLRKKTGELVRMVRIRNPWGTGEWEDAWSDQSSEWTSISDEERNKVGLVNVDDGEFWMCYEDFIKNFSRVDMCHLTSENKLNMASIKGKWIEGVTAGGTEIPSFCCNPQYKFTLTEPDEGNTQCNILIGLMPKQLLDVGCFIYKVDDKIAHPPLDYNFFLKNDPVNINRFSGSRERSSRCNLDPGSYVIIPYTETPDQEGEFLLRIMSEKKIQLTEFDGDVRFENEELAIPCDVFNADLGGIVDCNRLKRMIKYTSGLDLEHQEKISKEMFKKMILTPSGAARCGMSLEDFESLWPQLREWHVAFSKFGGETIPKRQLRSALRAARWNISVEQLHSLSDRYKSTDELYFKDFINCLLEVYSMFEKATKIDVIVPEAHEESPEKW